MSGIKMRMIIFKKPMVNALHILQISLAVIVDLSFAFYEGYRSSHSHPNFKYNVSFYYCL
jgi:hypothetical protein